VSSERLRVDRCGSAPAFLEAAEPFLLQAEAENALLLGVAGEGAEGYFAVIRDGPAVVLAAMRTWPGRAAISRSAAAGSLRLLAADLLAACPELESVVGPEPWAEECAGLLAAARGRPPRLLMAQRIHVLEQVLHPADLPGGRLREAELRDLPVLGPWTQAFLEAVGLEGDGKGLAEAKVAAGQLFLWEQERPVAMAAWSGKTPSGVRVNFVYTPPDERGKGYATAAVAALSQLLLDRGNRFCCLYTDLANPTSNAIYRRIGYQPVRDAGLHAV
jgi:predicted GNAT family acetyltransferase